MAMDYRDLAVYLKKKNIGYLVLGSIIFCEVYTSIKIPNRYENGTLETVTHLSLPFCMSLLKLKY